MITYPAELPVSERKDDIAAAIRDHQVVIVAGETGSGKTTQLPKICLELGRGVHGLIGHTQPRRLAARTVADRIAEELGTELGDVVGYKVRFTDQVSDRSLVKLMTDGILLAELQTDRMLRQYDTLIIDEAHERSLNIDFILGYLRQLLPRRPDLKVIITSATIETDRFARHFAGRPPPTSRTASRAGGRGVRADLPGGGALPAAGRGRRGRGGRRADEENVRDQIQAIGDAVEELAAEGPGDILVFLSGEREIRDTADALGKLVQTKRSLLGTEILPLYARLSAAEQHRVFAAARRAPGGARHQRRGDLADRARHQVRGGPGHRPDLPLLQPAQGAAAADRAGLAGVGQPAQGPLRPHLGRHLHPPLRRAGLRCPGPSSPTRRSCAPTWPRSSSR